MTTINGTDFVRGDNFNYRHLNKLKNCWIGAAAPTDPQAGMLWYDTGTGYLNVYDGAAWQALGGEFGVVPEGTIIPWIGGHFGDGANGTYARKLGTANTAAGANAYLNALGWYVCNGAALNDPASTIYNGAGRYLPNLTDDRFLMGDTGAGGIGGSNTMAHTHALNIANFQIANNLATIAVDDSGADITSPTPAHNHDVDFDNLAASGAASNTENRPAFIGVFYIQKVR